MIHNNPDRLYMNKNIPKILQKTNTVSKHTTLRGQPNHHSMTKIQTHLSNRKGKSTGIACNALRGSVTEMQNAIQMKAGVITSLADPKRTEFCDPAF